MGYIGLCLPKGSGLLTVLVFEKGCRDSDHFDLKEGMFFTVAWHWVFWLQGSN